MDLKEIIYTRDRINPSRISGPYSLLAVMLLVAEFLFAIWFFKAQNSTERTIAGSVMSLVFISLILSVLKMNQTPIKEKTNYSMSSNSNQNIGSPCLHIQKGPKRAIAVFEPDKHTKKK
jgi:hypothetical protein